MDLTTDKNVKNTFKSMKFFLKVGFFIGFFPLNYDRNLQTFKFRLFSRTSFFSLLRMTLILFLLSLPLLVFKNEEHDQINNAIDRENRTTIADEVRDALSINDLTGGIENIINLFFPILPFILGCSVAEPFTNIACIEQECKIPLVKAKKMCSKMHLGLGIYIFLFFFLFILSVITSLSMINIVTFLGVYNIFYEHFLRFYIYLAVMFYEIVFQRCMVSIQEDISGFAQKMNEFTLESCDLLIRKIKEFQRAFSFFLLLDITLLTLCWIFR